MDTKDRFRGCLLGLAVGDAVGTTLEFKSPGSFNPIHDMVGGGPFRLKSGEWTDDTSMALCLATSLLEKKFDPESDGSGPPVSNLGKFSNALAGLFDDYDSSPGQCICTIGDDLRKSLDNERCTSISQTEEDHSGLSTFRKGHYFAEVKIICDDHARLGDRLIENLAVGQALQSFVSEVGRVVSL